MTTPLWQPSDGQLLKSLREQAGLDRAVLARMASMTVQHLRGLEEGEGGEFYSPAIKAQMGRALLAKLGHVVTPAGDDSGQFPVTLAPPGLPAQATPARIAPRPPLRRAALLAVLAGGAFVVAVLALTPSRPASMRQAAAMPSPSPVSVGTAPAPVPVAGPPSAATAPAVASQPAAVCDPDDSRPRVDYTPPEPRKAGNFVHLVADKPLHLCVVDAGRKATRLELEPGAARSVYGAAPFVLQGEMAGLRVFYQGVRVQGDLSSASRIVLNEAPLR